MLTALPFCQAPHRPPPQSELQPLRSCSSADRLSPQRPIHIDKHAVQDRWSFTPFGRACRQLDVRGLPAHRTYAWSTGSRTRRQFGGNTPDTYLTPRTSNQSTRVPTGSCCRVAACYSWYDALTLQSRYALHSSAVTIACQPHLESSTL